MSKEKYLKPWLFVLSLLLTGLQPLQSMASEDRPYFAKFNEKSCMAPGQAAKSIFVFGDSLSTPYQLEKNKGYASMLAQYFGLPLNNYAVNGAETSAVLGQVKNAIRMKSVTPGSISIVLAGGNDFLRDRRQVDTSKNLATIVKQLKDQGSTVVLVGVPSKSFLALAGRLSDSDIYENVWKANQDIVFIPNLISSVLSDPKLKLDAIHPNEQGHLTLYNSIRYDLFVWSSYCHKSQNR